MQLDGSTDVFFHKKTNVSNLWGLFCADKWLNSMLPTR